MPINEERLVVALEARVTAFEKNFAKANRTANDNFGSIERRAKLSGDRMEKSMAGASARIGAKFKDFGAGLFAGMAAGGAAGILATLGQVAKGMAAIGDEARRAGLSNKAFQELKFVAEQNRVGVDSLVDGIKELNLRADEFIITGMGSGADAFKRLGYSAVELRDKLKDPSALFTEIIGKLQKLDRAAQIRIADEIFGGTGGEKFVQLIDLGEKGIRNQIKAAHDLGIVLDDEIIARAADIDRKFQAITTTISVNMKSAIVEAASALGTFVDTFREIDSRQTDTLKQELAAAERNLKAAQDRMEKGVGFFKPVFDKQIAQSQAEVDRLRAVLRDRALDSIRPQLEQHRAMFDRTTPGAKTDRLAPAVAPGAVTTIDRTVNSFERLDKAVNDFVDNVVRAESGGNANAKNPLSSATGVGQFIESTWLDLFKKNFPDRAAGMSEAMILALRKDAEISKSLIAAYARENANVLRQAGVSVDQAALQLAHFLGPQGAVAVLTAKAGTPVASVLGAAQIKANPSILGGGATVDDVIAYGNRRARAAVQNRDFADSEREVASGMKDVKIAADTAETATDQLGDSYSQIGQIGVGAMRGLVSALSDGKLEAGELLSILGDVIMSLIEAASVPQIGLGKSSGGGFWQSLIGLIPGLFADGGYTGHGGKYQPAGVVHKGEFVMSKAATSRIGVHTLDAIHRGALAGYADGGFVGTPPAFGSARSAAPISITNHVKVEGSAGTPAQNDDLAAKMAKTLESSMRGLVVSEMTKAMRPGNLANSRSR